MTQSISTERTLILPEYAGFTPGLSMPLVWPAKDPGDSHMDFSLDIGGWLTEIQDTIGSFQVGWTPNSGTGTPLVITSAFSHESVVTILASAGNAFDTYTVTIAVTTAINNDVLSRNIQLPVEPRYGNVIAPLSISGVVS